MLNNIKLIGIIFLSVLLLTNCKKEDKVDEQSPGELVFAPVDISDTEKDGFDVLCDLTLTITLAHVVLNGIDYYPLTFVLGDKLYTQSIKLDPGAYIINEFELMDDMGTPGFYDDDEIVKATPMWNSEYAVFVDNALMEPGEEYGFTIVEFLKLEVYIDVLCYIPSDFELFGFVWFDVTPITVREQCFFGDLCIYDLDLYYGSLYGPLIEADEKAIYKIMVYRDGEYVDEYFNTYYDAQQVFTYDSPLCVPYADYDLEENFFIFELWVLVPVGSGFEYVYMYTWDFWDAETILDDGDAGEDGVVDFVVGDCVVTPSDLVLPPWL